MVFSKVKAMKGECSPPPDKSITHRALIIASMAKAVSYIYLPLISLDTAKTIEVLKSLGVQISLTDDTLTVASEGYKAFKAPLRSLDCGNSGTTARLMAGLLCPQAFTSELSGDASLSRRPMLRVTEPLSLLGAKIEGDRLPISLYPSDCLHAAEAKPNTRSAQVKSAFMLAALQIEGVSRYTDSFTTRNHTELMLPIFGAELSTDGFTTELKGGADLRAAEITVPGDISSAAFLAAAALMFEGSDIRIQNVGLNPTRTAFLEILRSWGADIEIDLHEASYEPIGDVRLRHSSISGGEVSGELSSAAIDELPMLAMLGLFSEKAVTIRGAKELRIKESDRVKALVDNFRALGADVIEYEDGLAVAPLTNEPQRVVLRSAGDHRIAMLNVLLAKRYGLGIDEKDLDCIDVSFPGYLRLLDELEKAN